MKLAHRNHAPSRSIVEVIAKELKALQPDLQIDQARVHLEHRLTDSPPFSAFFHRVTAGPDVIVTATDHTFRAAVLKAFDGIADRIGHRHTKRSRRRETDPAFELTRRRPAGRQRN